MQNCESTEEETTSDKFAPARSDDTLLKGVLVGYGNVAKFSHLPWFINSEHVILAGVADPHVAKIASDDLKARGIAVSNSFDDLIMSTDADFIVVATPPAYHKELIERGLKRHLHVFCEKPPLKSIAELGSIRSVRGASPLVVQACHNWHFAPAIRRMFELVFQGAIGDPLTFRCSLKRTHCARGVSGFDEGWRLNARHGGGIVGDLGYHCFYLANRLFGGPPLSLNAYGTLGREVEIEALINLNYGEGRVAICDLSWASNKRESVLEIRGTRGTACIDDVSLETVTPEGSLREDFAALSKDSWHADWTFAALDGFVRNMADSDYEAPWREMTDAVAVLESVYLALSSNGLTINLGQLPSDFKRLRDIR